jgi:iron complex transport system substrate-binding protein
MKRKTGSTFFLGLMVVVGAACTPAAVRPTATPVSAASATPTAAPQPSATPAPLPTASPTSAAIEWRDDLGRQGELPGPAKRVISLAPSNTEILFAIGAGDVLVGREQMSDYPPEALEVESIGSVYGDINLEAIVSLNPDLVLAAEINSPEHVEAIAQLGIPVYYLGNPQDFKGLYDNLETVGRLTGHEAEAKDLIAQLAGRVKNVQEALQGRQPVSVYYEIDGTDDPTAPWTTGSGTFQNRLINMAGGENIASDLEAWAKISVEEIIARDPEVIIFEEGPWVPTTAESIAEREGWGDIQAVAEGRVYGIDTQWTGRPGPRYMDALEAMAEMLHPEAFNE